MGVAVAESEFAAGRFWNARACAFVRSKSLDYHHIPVFDAGDMLRITLLISSAVVLLIWRTLQKNRSATKWTFTGRLTRRGCQGTSFVLLVPCESGTWNEFSDYSFEGLGWTSRRTGVARRPQTRDGDSDHQRL